MLVPVDSTDEADIEALSKFNTTKYFQVLPIAHITAKNNSGNVVTAIMLYVLKYVDLLILERLKEQIRNPELQRMPGT